MKVLEVGLTCWIDNKRASSRAPENGASDRLIEKKKGGIIGYATHSVCKRMLRTRALNFN